MAFPSAGSINVGEIRRG